MTAPSPKQAGAPPAWRPAGPASEAPREGPRPSGATQDPRLEPERLADLSDQDRDQLARELAEAHDAPAGHLRAELDLLARRANPDDPARASRYNAESTTGSTVRKVRRGGSPGERETPANRLQAQETGAVAPDRPDDWRDVFNAHGPDPDHARGGPRLHPKQARRARRLFIDDGLGAGAIAQRLGVGVLAVFDELEPLAKHRADQDADVPYPNHLLLDDQADPRAADPIALEDGAVYMVGSQPPRDDNCLRRHLLECRPCLNRHNAGLTIPAPDGHRDPDADVEGNVPWPRAYVPMERPAGCEWPACRVCKTIYTPTRAAAGAARTTQAVELHDREGQPVDVWHVILSPPQDGDAAQLDTQADVRHLYDQARELLDRKGALGWCAVLHPWRGEPDDWRTSPHLHAVVAFPKGTSHKLGGKTCCRHRGVYDDDVDPDTPCCNGTCSDPFCPHREAEQARQDAQAAGARVGAHVRHGNPTREAQARRELEAAQDKLEAAKARACDRGWVTHVREHNGQPVDVRGEQRRHGYGVREGALVDQGLFDLLQYELDHAGVLVDEHDTSKGHVLRWGGAWSYNRLELEGPRGDLVDELMADEDTGPACPACGARNLDPLTDPTERARVQQILNDAQARARLEARWETARDELEHLEDADPDHAPREGDADRPPPQEAPTDA